MPMERVRIDTAQNVKIDYTLATLGDRMAAWAIDLVVMVAWVIFMLQIADSIAYLNDEDSGLYILLTLIFLPIAFYHLFSELLLNGQSVGKLAMKIKVVRLDGSTPTLGNYLMRWILRIVEFTTFTGLAMLVYLISGKGQRLGDVFAGTTVIRRRRKYTLKDTILYNLDASYQPVYPQVRNFSNRDVEIIREGIAYAAKYNNPHILVLLNDQVSKTMNLESQPVAYAEFLDTVVKDYNYYQTMEALEQ
jgi:uncharacterized RDD family membrane protein YckC